MMEEFREWIGVRGGDGILGVDSGWPPTRTVKVLGYEHNGLLIVGKRKRQSGDTAVKQVAIVDVTSMFGKLEESLLRPWLSNLKVKGIVN